MKKIVGYIILFISIILIASCSSKTDSKATCTYYVATDSIVYADSIDQADYDSLVKAAIVSLKLTSYSFTEEGASENGLTSYAIETCDAKAFSTFQKNAIAPTLSAIRNELFSKNSQYFADKNITSAEDITLKPFSVYLTLWNFTYQYTFHSVKLDVR
jgi:hypothetical protein